MGVVSASSPADLAVAFRSFPRRVHESVALARTADARAKAASAERVVAKVLTDAAVLLGTRSTGHISDVAAGVADFMDDESPEEWRDDRLEKLRALAREAGVALRGAAPDDNDD